MKKGSIYLLLSSLFIMACGDGKKETGKEEAAQAGNFVVEGTMENGAGKVIVLARIGMQGGDVMASDTVDRDGKFRLEGFAREKFIGVFNFDETRKIFLIIDTTSQISLQVPSENYDRYTVEGSEESAVFQRLRDIEVRSGKELAAIREEAEKLSPDDEQTLEKLREKFMAVNQRYVKEYGDSLRHVNSPLVKLYYHYILQVPFDDEQKELLYEEAKNSGLKSDLVTNFISRYEVEQNTAIGKTAPEIVLQDSGGTVIPLSSLRGKVVLIDFWASWCGPCRQENPNVRKLYHRFKDKGFEIYGVSLDKDMMSWVNAIHEDEIHWVHVSDLQEWRSAAASQYAVTAIPATFLLDREGKIIAKNLRGKELEKKLIEALK